MNLACLKNTNKCKKDSMRVCLQQAHRGSSGLNRISYLRMKKERNRQVSSLQLLLAFFLILITTTGNASE
jgi:hypothetical protein